MSTSNAEWKLVDQVNGSTQGEILKGLLNAQGIEVILSEEGAGRTLGLEFGPMGIVEILVPESSYDEAKSILDGYYRGDLDLSSQEADPPGDGSS